MRGLDQMNQTDQTDQIDQTAQTTGSGRDRALNRRIWRRAAQLRLDHDQVSDINHRLTGHRIKLNTWAEDMKLLRELEARRPPVRSGRARSTKSRRPRRLYFHEQFSAQQMALIEALRADLGLSVSGYQSIVRRSLHGRHLIESHADAASVIAALKNIKRNRRK